MHINILLFIIFYIFIIFIINRFLSNILFSYLLLFLITLIYFILVNLYIKIHNLSKNVILVETKPTKHNNTLKVALCISGKIDNNIKNIYNTWKKNILDHYNVDIFMNTDKNNDFIKNVIKPKKVVIFNEDIHLKNNLNINSNIMFYRIYHCNRYRIEYEKKNNIKYDLIIRIRSDIFLYDRLYLENFNKNIAYFPLKTLDLFYNMANELNFGITDQFFISDRNLMNKICDIYLMLENSKYSKIECGFPEIHLLYYIKNNNIKYNFFKYKWHINYHLEDTFYSNMKMFMKIKDIKLDCFTKN